MSFNSRKLLFGSPNFTDPYWNNVSLLLHGDGIGATPNGQQNNTFLDSSTNNFTITRSGSATQGSFSPFALNGSAYSPTVHGGSGYFNGSSNLFNNTSPSAALGIGSSQFTYEAWIYVNAYTSGGAVIFSNYNAVSGADGLALFVSATGVLGIGENSGSTLASGGTIPLNTWTHVAGVRDSVSWKLYVNGNQTATSSINFSKTYASTGKCFIGSIIQIDSTSSGYPVNGYISNLRFTKGLAVYTSNFTPPTSPVTLTSNGGATPSTAPTSGQVSLLCNFTNGGIFDNTKNNVLTTVGNANVSTSVVKYGTGSMAFDGSGDYLSNYTSQGAASTTFGTASFTVEMWVYFNTVAGDQGIIDASPRLGASSGLGQFYLYKSTNSLIFGNYNIGNLLIYAWTPSQSTWYHIAVSRSGTTLKMFINGTQVESATNSNNFNGLGITVGAAVNPYYLNGYIDDLRITKGVARYTSAFTPPTRAFPNK